MSRVTVVVSFAYMNSFTFYLQNVCYSLCLQVTKDGHHSLIKLVAFRANPIIATQLVGLINATHVPVVEGNTFRTGNVAGTAVPSLATNGGG